MLVGTAHAYEYKLQFTPPSGAKGVSVVGYAFTDAGGVSGLVQYALSRCSSGRGAHCITTQYDYSATWDLNVAQVTVSAAPSGSLGGVPNHPTTIQRTPSTQGLIYATVTLTLVTDPGQSFDFTRIYTVTGVPVCDD